MALLAGVLRELLAFVEAPLVLRTLPEDVEWVEGSGACDATS